MQPVDQRPVVLPRRPDGRLLEEAQYVAAVLHGVVASAKPLGDLGIGQSGVDEFTEGSLFVSSPGRARRFQLRAGMLGLLACQFSQESGVNASSVI